ncbi:MAG: hypothetical protein ACK5HY_00090, partial [Parahaliea sp.]
MKKSCFRMSLLAFLATQQARAGGLYVQLFLDDAPLQGVEASLDGSPLGDTGARDDIDAGSHVLILSDDDLRFPIEFDATAEEDVEVSVLFTTAEGDEPR